MHAGVDLRVPARRLRHAPQPIELGKDDGERAGRTQHREVHLRRGLGERLHRFLPHPLGHERAGFARRDHRLHQGERVRRDLEAEGGEARGEACDPQDPYGVLDEGSRDVAQAASGQVGRAAVRVD